MHNRILDAMRAHRLPVLILGAFLVLAATYSFVTPIFEAGDEIWHYPFVQFVAAGHGLPVQDPNVKTLWEQEGGQPPLYYAVSALSTFWIDSRDLPDRLWRNPEARIGIPLDFGNKNLIVHTSAEDFPWHNTALAVHLIRFLSILLSACTVVLTYFLALEIKPNDKGPAALAAALVAFNPMFLFISASVNNDNLAVMLAALALLLLARLVKQGNADSAPSWRPYVVLGVVLGLAALSKVSDLGLLALAGCVFVYLLWRTGRVPPVENSQNRLLDTGNPYLPLISRMLVCSLIIAAIAGWWYVRNWLLYGDPLAFNVWVAIAGGRPTPATLWTLLGEFQGFRISYWGNFGGVNIIAPDWVYSILDGFTAIAAIGLLVGLVRRTLPGLLALPALWLGLILVSLVRWTLLTFASQGRLIFPAIGAVSILLAYGFEQLTIRSAGATGRRDFLRSAIRHTANGQLPLALFLLVFSALTPFALVAPAYALPARLPVDATIPNPTRITFDGQAELVGYALPEKGVAPGGVLPITVYWSTVTRLNEDYSVYLRLFDSTGKIVGRWDAFPGGGLYPTRFWQPGEIVVDNYRVPVSPAALGPTVGRIEVGLFRRDPLESLTARDPQGNTITPTLARFKITGHLQVQVEGAQEPTIFGDQVALVGYQHSQSAAAGSNLTIKVYWRALAAMSEDYTVFVHLIDATGKTVAQNDNQPQSGAYPTSFWDTGEIVPDTYALAVPPALTAGDYRIEMGVYRARDSSRLPVRNGGDAIGLGTVQVTR